MRPRLYPLRSAPAGLLWLLAMHAFAQDADAPGAESSAAQTEAEPLGPKTPGADPPAPLAAPTQAAAEQPSIASAELERRGATIRAINIIVDNVFDPEGNPKEDKALYRFANRVHVRSRPDVIQTALLFKAGDRYEGRVLDESARALRARGFLADVRIAYRTYDAASNSVDVEVRVRDAWSLSLNAKLSHSGGKTEWGLGLDDDNFLGYGKEVNVNYKSTIDRDESLLGYRDDNVLHTRMRLGAVFANASDGYRRELYAERPFYSLDARWMTGGQYLDQRRVDTMYDLGHEIDEFRHDIRDLTIRGGLSRGIVDSRTRRWLFGVSSEEDTFVPTERTPQPLLLPPDRKLVYPWIGWQLVADDFREMTELNDMGRTEDVALGINLFASIGFAEKSLGSDRDATLLRATVTRGWEPGTRDLLQLGVGTSTRHERDGFKNSVTKLDARYYRRNSDSRLLSVSLSALATHELDPDTQVLLGGDSGLRGYPIRYQAGENRVLFTVEQRFYTDFYPWRLFRFGYAAFFDAGRVTGRDPRASAPLGTLYDVGFGLRLTSPRASSGQILHIDLAFPLNAPPNIDNVQLIVETKATF
jgi:hypothetical protein